MATGHSGAGVREELPRDKYEQRDDIGGRPLTALALGVILVKAFGFLKDMLYPTPIRLFGPPTADAMPAGFAEAVKPVAFVADGDAGGPDGDDEDHGEEQAAAAQIEPPATGSGGNPKLGLGGPVAIFAQGDSFLPVTLGIGNAAIPLPIRLPGNDNATGPVHVAGAGAFGAVSRAAGGPRSDGASEDNVPDGDVPDDDDGDDQDPDGQGGDRTNRAPTVSNTVFLYDIFVSQAVLIGVVELLRHAGDADGDRLAVRNLQASSGQVTQVAEGRWQFTAAPETLGEVTFTYEVTDGEASVAQTAMLRVVDVPGRRIEGTQAGEILVGSAGADVIEAQGGDDVVVAREGSDLVDGGDGNDRIVGGSGDDVLFGGAGHDVLLGGDGNDSLDGGPGSDVLFGDAGRDVIAGGEGGDTAHDGAGADVVDLGGGDDLMTVAHDTDGDLFDGGAGKDTISFASVGADASDVGVVVDLEAGTAEIGRTGGAGDPAATEPSPADAAASAPAANEASQTDTATVPVPAATAAEADVAESAASASAANDASQADTATVPVSTASATEIVIDRIAGFEDVIGSPGADTIIGDDTPNVITGGAGADVMDGRGGDDTFVATVGDGSDVIDGGIGIDTLDYSAETAPVIADLDTGTVTAADGSVDEVARIEVVVLGAGRDVVVMSTEQTDVWGGAEGDIFVFKSSGSSGPGSGSRDRIMDFEAGDRIDLDGITDEFAPELAEAISDQDLRRFVMIKEGDAFSKPGQLRLAYEELDGQKVAVLQGNIDHDAAPEFEIELHGYLDITYDQLTYGV